MNEAHKVKRLFTDVFHKMNETKKFHKLMGTNAIGSWKKNTGRTKNREWSPTSETSEETSANGEREF